MGLLHKKDVKWCILHCQNKGVEKTDMKYVYDIMQPLYNTTQLLQSRNL